MLIISNILYHIIWKEHKYNHIKSKFIFKKHLRVCGGGQVRNLFFIYIIYFSWQCNYFDKLCNVCVSFAFTILANYLLFQGILNSDKLEDNVQANILGFVVVDKCEICFSFTLLTLVDDEIYVWSTILFQLC